MNAPAKPLPDPSEPLAAQFWVATAQSRLAVQKCGNCGYFRWPPAPVCPECQGTDTEWTDVSPTSSLWSYATYHRALDKAFEDDIPYTVGLIQLDSGPRMIGTVLAAPEDLAINQRVRAVFDPVTSDVTLVRWELARDD